MIHLGIDPGTSMTAFATWGANGPLAAKVCKAKAGKQPGPARLAQALLDFIYIGDFATIVVEGQQIDTRSKSKANILTLAQSAGVAVAWAAREHFDTPILIPTPTEWKGGVAKHAHQGRMYLELGWGSTVIGSGKNRYARPIKIPVGFKHILPGQWKDVGDALALARWGYQQHTT